MLIRLPRRNHRSVVSCNSIVARMPSSCTGSTQDKPKYQCRSSPTGQRSCSKCRCSRMRLSGRPQHRVNPSHLPSPPTLLQSARFFRGLPFMSKKNIVHVVGTGTIGEPLIGLFTDFKEKWGIDEVTFHKRTP